MKIELIDRIIEEAEYIVSTGTTVRGASKIFWVSKSTIHKDVTDRLKKVDKSLYKKVKKVLDKNLSERHIRGGEATKKKYKTISKKTHSR